MSRSLLSLIISMAPEDQILDLAGQGSLQYLRHPISELQNCQAEDPAGLVTFHSGQEPRQLQSGPSRQLLENGAQRFSLHGVQLGESGTKIHHPGQNLPA